MFERSVLLIDDSEDDRYFYKRLLNKSESKWHISEASCGESGLALLQSLSPDAILLDYSLPGSDGVSTLSVIKEMYPFIPVIMLTGQGNERIAVESLKQGASDYLIKGDLTAFSLEKAVDSAINSASLEQRIATQKHELEQFARVLAHDLKQPANAIRSMADILIKKYQTELPQDAQLKVKLMRDTATQMSELIKALVAYTKLELILPVFESTDVQKCIAIVQATLNNKIEQKNAQISVESMPVIHAIPSFVIQLFQILIDNAMTYCEQAPVITITAKSFEGYWQFCVKDNGIGIPDKEQHRVFDPLVRLHSNDTIKGTGLGLSTAKRIVEKHRGSIQCFSNEKEGVSFKFSITKVAIPDPANE